MTKERQIRKQEETRNTILAAARDIVSAEGIGGLSIRKIAAAIDYSPAIIYHYFRDKSAIVDSLVSQGYQRILASIRAVPPDEVEPENEMKAVFDGYIRAALANPEEYKAFLLNGDPAVLQKTAVLKRGISQESQTIQYLCNLLQRGIERGRFAPCDPELTAQVIWTATFGLIIKLILEKDVGPEQVERLICRQFSLLLKGIMKSGGDKNG